MKTLAKVLLWITGFVLLAAALYILSSRPVCRVSVTVTPATDQLDLFREIESEAAEGFYEGVTALRGADEYYFSTVTVNIKSLSPFRTEWLTFTEEALDGDVLLCDSDSGPKDLDPFGEGTVSYTVLTLNDLPIRGGRVDYYVFGRYHSVDVQYIV